MDRSLLILVLVIFSNLTYAVQRNTVPTNKCVWKLHPNGVPFDIRHDAYPGERFSDCINHIAAFGFLTRWDSPAVPDLYDGVFQMEDASGKVVAECSSHTISGISSEERMIFLKWFFSAQLDNPAPAYETLRTSEYFQNLFKNHVATDCKTIEENPS